MKKIVVFLTNLVLLTILETISRVLIRDGIGNYFKYFDFYSFKWDLIAGVIVVLFLLLIHAFLFKLAFKYKQLEFQACVIGVFGALLYYLGHAFGGGFVIILKISSETLLGMARLFILGLILPFSETWIATLLNKIWKK